jgi:hypothetical protein
MLNVNKLWAAQAIRPKGLRARDDDRRVGLGRNGASLGVLYTSGEGRCDADEGEKRKNKGEEGRTSD